MFADALNSIVGRLYLAMRREEGQTLVEYTMIGALVALVVAAAVILLQKDITSELGKISGAL
jgi:Flp pilus assembly pilin Flp